MASGKINISIIGAGKIAYSLTNALVLSGYNISSVISKNISSAKRLAKLFQVKNFSNRLEEIPPETNLFLICVPDSQIEILDSQLSQLPLNFRRDIFVHFSGAENSLALKCLNNKKAMSASFHIMQTFSSKKIISLSKSFAAIETKYAQAEKELFTIAEKLDLIPFKVNSSKKIFYHLAGVYASNYFVGNIFSAQEFFKKSGIKKISFNDLIIPIVNSTLNNIKVSGAEDSLSGPVERGDLKTVQNHLSVLKKNFAGAKNKFMILNYISQALLLLNLIKKKSGKLSNPHLKIEKFLVKELKNYRA